MKETLMNLGSLQRRAGVLEPDAEPAGTTPAGPQFTSMLTHGLGRLEDILEHPPAGPDMPPRRELLGVRWEQGHLLPDEVRPRWVQRRSAVRIELLAAIAGLFTLAAMALRLIG